MAVKIRVVQDRRAVSRVVARLECQCTFGEESRQAKVINISLKGAYLSSPIQPPQNTDAKISIKTSLLKKPLIIEGKVIRVGMGISEQGKQYRFGVRFYYTPLDLTTLINKLISQPSTLS